MLKKEVGRQPKARLDLLPQTKKLRQRVDGKFEDVLDQLERLTKKVDFLISPSLEITLRLLRRVCSHTFAQKSTQREAAASFKLVCSQRISVDVVVTAIVALRRSERQILDHEHCFFIQISCKRWTLVQYERGEAKACEKIKIECRAILVHGPACCTRRRV